MSDYVPPDPPVAPYLMVHDGPGAIEWYGRAFGTTVVFRHHEADGRVGHVLSSLGPKSGP